MSERIKFTLRKIPLHVVVIFLCVLWVTPTIGLLVASFRPRQDVVETGWWMAFAPRKSVGQGEYNQYCSSCHGVDGAAVAEADLSSPSLIEQYRRSIALTADLRGPLQDGTAHVEEMPDAQQTADILTYLRQLSGADNADTRPLFTTDN
jgi:alpha-glucoside transport system permease protein